MEQATPFYASYLLRFWHESGTLPTACWQTELEHIQTGERHRFADLDTLCHFLRCNLPPGEEYVPQIPDPVAPPNAAT